MGHPMFICLAEFLPGATRPSFLVMATQEISGLPFLCWVPDVQNFNGIVLRAVGDDMRQAPLQ